MNKITNRGRTAIKRNKENIEKETMYYLFGGDGKWFTGESTIVEKVSFEEDIDKIEEDFSDFTADINIKYDIKRRISENYDRVKEEQLNMKEHEECIITFFVLAIIITLIYLAG